MYRKKSFFWSLFSGLLGFVLFIVMLSFANLLIPILNNAVFSKIVLFLDSNIFLVITISLIFLIADLFNSLIFPFNLPYPLFGAIGGMFMITFLLRLFGVIEEIVGSRIFDIFRPFVFLLYPVFFILILLGGYIEIFSRLAHPLDEEEIDLRARRKERRLRGKEEARRTWEDIGDEFRSALYDIATAFRNAVKPKERRKRRR